MWIRYRFRLKSSLVALLVLVLLVVASGCNDNTAKGNPPKTDKPLVETPKAAPPLSVFATDLRLRKAIALAIDLDLGDETTPLQMFYKVPRPDQDLDKAKLLWQEATEAMDKPVVLRLLTFDADQSQAVAQSIKAQLEATLADLEVQITALPYKEKQAAAYRGDFDLEFTGWEPNYPDPQDFLSIWHSKSVSNSGGFKDLDLDKLLESPVLDLDTSERDQALTKLETMIVQDHIAAIPLFRGGHFVWVQEDAQGLQQFRTTAKGIGFRTQASGSSEPSSSEPSSLDPSNLDPSAQVNLLQGLVRLDDQGQVLPDGALSWTISEDALSYTFLLPPNALLADGTPLMASAYEQAIAARLPEGVSKVEALEPTTLKITLSEPQPYLLKVLAQAAYGVMAGPYRIEQEDPQYGMTLVKNPHYKGSLSQPYLRIQYLYIKDLDVARDRFMEGRLERIPTQALYYLAFNFR